MLGARDTEALPLYTAIVARGREPHWYVEGQVADTIDGRFDMIAGVLAFVLLRLEDDPAGAETVARVTERFVEDMDGQLRQIGIGDIIVGKHIGKMMSMLGGRIGAYRDALAAGNLDAALVRNLYRGETPSEPGLRHVAARLYALRDALAAAPTAAIIAGDLP
ncbi:ubiquinol-cytochrome C chaperone family protein [Sphingomonas sp. NFR15]|uniref:ubiquinol-cytochrome C chaperone family protein n=1 Tax=Sphingomonas sp. NFR15 TaxID=1566282 RepID=UPI00088A425C|nr:ubiquinol-cytochrome C chaperone family protein [Sphingomonas sp. NFR15]SDA33383.1 cytochrome b pre-mRNA-processing protein 3 [Sphingomonas sp. NFR15]